MYLEKSITTAGPTVCPERLVAAPRGRIGTPSSAAILTIATTSSAVLGTTTPRGSTWYRLASVAYSQRVPRSKRTSARVSRLRRSPSRAGAGRVVVCIVASSYAFVAVLLRGGGPIVSGKRHRLPCHSARPPGPLHPMRRAPHPPSGHPLPPGEGKI